MALVLDLDAGSGRDDVTGNLGTGGVSDYQIGSVDCCVDLGTVSFVCSKRQRVDVAMELDGVVFDDGIFVIGRSGKHRNIRQEVLAFVAPFLIWYRARGTVDHRIPCPAQPCLCFGIQVLDRAELPVEKEVLLDVFDGILNLALALRIGRAAEDHLERAALHIRLEDSCHAVVSKMFVVKEYCILVVDDEVGHPVDIIRRTSHGPGWRFRW